jgi:hypothetical protein
MTSARSCNGDIALLLFNHGEGNRPILEGTNPGLKGQVTEELRASVLTLPMA